MAEPKVNAETDLNPKKTRKARTVKSKSDSLADLIEKTRYMPLDFLAAYAKGIKAEIDRRRDEIKKILESTEGI